jgi:hypothetical protein
VFKEMGESGMFSRFESRPGVCASIADKVVQRGVLYADYAQAVLKHGSLVVSKHFHSSHEFVNRWLSAFASLMSFAY